MPEHDVTLTAKYRATDRRAVTVKYYMENLDGTYNATPESTAVIYGQTGTAITPAPEVFAGFKTQEAKSVTVSDEEVRYVSTGMRERNTQLHGMPAREN